jgi:hypothetical protein
LLNSNREEDHYGVLKPKEVEAFAAISDIIVQISDEDLERVELLSQQIT